ncbi:hypothetical protein CLI70_00030 [Prevotella intermedia]|nr:hypothetical protein CLI70_00030 [Prevotella intermedia]
MSKTAAIPMDKEIQSFQFIFTGQQYSIIYFSSKLCKEKVLLKTIIYRNYSTLEICKGAPKRQKYCL